jgi:hypothetical protein
LVKARLANITSISPLANPPTPTVILTGVRSGSSFTHTVEFGSTQAGVIKNQSLVLASAVGRPNATFTSSADATSTQVVVHSMDGLVASKDSAQITNNQGSFSGTYSVNVPPNSRINPNVTLLQEPPVLAATRTIDKGSAVSGDLVSVTLLFSNRDLSGTIQNISVNDSWWKAYPSLLAVSAGNSSFTIPSLASNQNVSRVYVLKVISSTAEDLTLPSAGVSYSYGIGGLTVNASTKLNQDELRTNGVGPALMIKAGTDIHSGLPIGTTGHYVVTVTNVGNGPALDLKVGNFTNPTLPQDGGVWKFNTTLPLTSIVARNLTQTFTVGWTAPDGSKATLVSNPASIVSSHSGILVPLMQLSVAATLSPAVLKLGSANATYILTNAGSAASTSVNATEALATGMACKSVTNGTANCTSSGFSVAAGSIAPSGDVRGKLVITFSNDNYLSEPGFITTEYSGVTLHTAGNELIVPAGVVVTKTYAANSVFQGQNDTVTVHVANQGTLPVYNMSVTAQSDSFDRTNGGTLHQTYATLSPNSLQSFNYSVQVLAAGNHTAANTSVAYSFGGSAQAYAIPSSNVLVYKVVKDATTTTPSTPVEGAAFSLVVNIENPSAVNVTNVVVSIRIPQGVTIINASSDIEVKGDALTLSLPSLPAGVTSTRSATLRASSDSSVNLGNETLTFQYSGETIHGVVSSPAIVVGVDLLVRYELPIGLAVLLLIAVAFYMHRKPTAPQAK